MNTTEKESGTGESQTFYLRESLVRKLMVGSVKLLFKMVMTLHIEGLENLPPEGACIVAANHLSTFDVFPLQFALPRPVFFMAKAELFSNPVLGWVVRELGAFPVRRGASDQWAMEHARRVLASGLALGMFPEGTRSRGRGLAVARTGAARLAIETNIPLVPVAIDGSQAFFRGFRRRKLVRVRIAPALFPQPDDDPLSLTERTMFALAASLPAELRGVYSAEPKGFVR